MLVALNGVGSAALDVDASVKVPDAEAWTPQGKCLSTRQASCECLLACDVYGGDNSVCNGKSDIEIQGLVDNAISKVFSTDLNDDINEENMCLSDMTQESCEAKKNKGACTWGQVSKA